MLCKNLASGFRAPACPERRVAPRRLAMGQRSMARPRLSRPLLAAAEPHEACNLELFSRRAYAVGGPHPGDALYTGAGFKAACTAIQHVLDAPMPDPTGWALDIAAPGPQEAAARQPRSPARSRTAEGTSSSPAAQPEASGAALWQLQSLPEAEDGLVVASLGPALPPPQPPAQTCISVHPGSVACTVTTVQRDNVTKTVVIHLTTTVRQMPRAAGAAAAGLDDLEQLGLLASVARLSEAATRLAAPELAVPRDVQARHDAWLASLAAGHVVAAKRTTNGFGHITFNCQLEDPNTGTKYGGLNAIVKPAVEGDGDGWHRVAVEVVAYRLNRLLGMDYVPPSVLRRDVDVDWERHPSAVFMYWAEHGTALPAVPSRQWGVRKELLLSDTRVLDVLIQNSDRHGGHFLMAEHWAHGEFAPPSGRGGGGDGDGDGGVWRGARRPVLIDHAAGFRHTAEVTLTQENAFSTGPVKVVSARTFLRLRCLTRETVAQAVGDLISPEEVDGLMRRREGILAYFDRLIRRNGYEAVVLEPLQA